MMENDAIINGILSFFIPGLGQAIEGYKARGIILFIISLIIASIVYFLHIEGYLKYVVSIVYGLLVAYDAYRLY